MDFKALFLTLFGLERIPTPLGFCLKTQERKKIKRWFLVKLYVVWPLSEIRTDVRDWYRFSKNQIHNTSYLLFG